MLSMKKILVASAILIAPFSVFASSCDNREMIIVNQTDYNLSVFVFEQTGHYTPSQLSLKPDEKGAIVVTASKGSKGDAEGTLLIADSANSNRYSKIKFIFDTEFFGRFFDKDCIVSANVTGSSYTFLTQIDGNNTNDNLTFINK